MSKKKTFTGLLNQQIEIHQNADIDNGSGGTMPGMELYWATVARVEPLKSRRDLQANQETLKDGFKFTIRDRVDKTIAPDMLIKYRGGLLTIQSAIPDYVYQEFLTIIAIWSQRPER